MDSRRLAAARSVELKPPSDGDASRLRSRVLCHDGLHTMLRAEHCPEILPGRSDRQSADEDDDSFLEASVLLMTSWAVEEYFSKQSSKSKTNKQIDPLTLSTGGKKMSENLRET